MLSATRGAFMQYFNTAFRCLKLTAIFGRLSQYGIIGFSCLLLFLLIGCTNSVRISVVPENPGIGLRYIDVFPRINSDAEEKSKRIQRDFSNFVIELDELTPNIGDLVSIRLEILDADKCVVASGLGTVTISEQRLYELRIPLIGFSRSSCILQVEMGGKGSGRVISKPPGIDCPGSCEHRFLPDEVVELSATPTAPWYFNGWAGACRGTNACTVSIGHTPQIVKLSFVAPPVCSSDNWCWENPKPLGTQLRGGVMYPSPYTSWVLGAGGTILRYENGILSQDESGTNEQLNAISGSLNCQSSGSVIVGNSGTILECRGSRWRSAWGVGTPIAQATGENLYAINGRRIVGANGTIIDSCPTLCTKRPDTLGLGRTATTPGIDLLATDGKWAVGTEGIILDISKNPATISRSRNGANTTLYGVSGDWVVGAKGTLLHYDVATAQWQAVASGTTKDLYAICSDFAVGQDGIILQRSGQAWNVVASGTSRTLRSVLETQNVGTALPLAERWALGDNGTLIHWDGTSWKSILQSEDTVIGTSNLTAIAGSGENDVWVAGKDLFHWDGVSWKYAQEIEPIPKNIQAIWCASSEFCAALSTSSFFQWDGHIWSEVSAPFTIGANVFATNSSIYGYSASNFWVGARDGVYHWDGKNWALEQDSPANAWYLSGDSFGNLWATSASVRWKYRKDGIWTDRPWGAVPLDGVFPNRARSIVSYGLIESWFFYGGQLFRAVIFDFFGRQTLGFFDQGLQIGNITSTWSSAPNRIWAISDAYGTSGILRYNGAGWNFVNASTVGYPPQMQAIWGSSSDNIWAVGANGTIIRYRP